MRERYVSFFQESSKALSTQIEAVNAYFGFAYQDINKLLRGQSSSNKSSAKKYISEIDSLMKDHTIKYKTVYRGIADDVFALMGGYSHEADLKKLKIGEVYESKSYTSTSPDIKVADWFGRIILKLNLKTNTHGIDREDFGNFSSNGNEILLDRNLRFKVIGFSSYNDKPVIEMKMI